MVLGCQTDQTEPLQLLSRCLGMNTQGLRQIRFSLCDPYK